MRLISIILTIMTSLTVFGLNCADTVSVHFRVGHRYYDPSLGDNREVMDSFVKSVREAVEAGTVERITVYGYASPEGQVRANERLARKRCDTIARYIADHTGVDSTLIEERAMPIWNDRLRRLVAESTALPGRDKVLDILDNTPVKVFDAQGRLIDSRKKQLMDLNGGRTWRWMYVHIFPDVRNAVAISLYCRPTPSNKVVDNTESAVDNAGALAPEALSPALPESTADTVESNLPEPEGTDTDNVRECAGECADTPDSEHGSPAIEHAPFHRLALKTNALYYAALLPNLELEWLINEHWSVAVEGNFACWGSYKKERSYRLAIFDAEGRRWFKTRGPWHGMYAGVIAGGGYYDIEKGTPGHYGWGVMTGLSFGYMWPIGRRLSLEAEIGAGYMFTRYKDYRPYEGHHVYLATKELNYFGPIKLKFSIVWRFFDSNKPKQGGPAL